MTKNVDLGNFCPNFREIFFLNMRPLKVENLNKLYRLFKRLRYYDKTSVMHLC